MAKQQLSQNLYKTPFSKAYWRDACAELKNPRMLVFAAFMIALRLAIPLAPNLKINTAFLVNAYGAMIYGPVISVIAAAISDTLGCIIWPSGVYFFPYIFLEIGGSLIFSLFLYRTKVTTTRLIFSRFTICLVINVLLNAPITAAYYQFVLGKSYDWMLWPGIIKNICMFPLESFLLAFFFKILMPVGKRFRLIPHDGADLKFGKKQIVLLVCLFACAVIGAGSYWVYNYNTSNQASWLSAEECATLNGNIEELVNQELPLADNQFAVIYKVEKSLGGDTQVTYYVYEVDDTLNADSYAGFYNGGISKSLRSDHMTKIATGTCTLVGDDLNNITNFTVTPTE